MASIAKGTPVNIIKYRLIYACETCKFCDRPAPEVRGDDYYSCKLRSTIGIDVIVEPTGLCNEWRFGCSPLALSRYHRIYSREEIAILNGMQKRLDDV